MHAADKKWICWVVAVVWLIACGVRILENASTSVILVTFLAAVIFYLLGVYYLKKAK